MKHTVSHGANDLSIRNNILLDSVRETLDIDNYSRMRYEESIAEVPIFDGDNDEEKRRREISYLNINWFMTNLFDRKDRMSMASGLKCVCRSATIDLSSTFGIYLGK